MSLESINHSLHVEWKHNKKKHLRQLRRKILQSLSYILMYIGTIDSLQSVLMNVKKKLSKSVTLVVPDLSHNIDFIISHSTFHFIWFYLLFYFILSFVLFRCTFRFISFYLLFYFVLSFVSFRCTFRFIPFYLLFYSVVPFVLFRFISFYLSFFQFILPSFS